MLPRGRPGIPRPFRIKGRITRLLLAVITAIGVIGLAEGTASATNSFDNASIADLALSHVGQSGGQCKQFANDMVSAASSGTVGIGGGYYAPYSSAGGVLDSASTAVKGDIIQLNKAADRETYYTGMHTAIVVSYQGSNVFDVVDSNWGTPLNNEIVHHHTWNPYTTASQYGLEVNIWRLGTVTSASSTHIAGDYDGNGYTDPTTWRSSDGVWRSYNGGVTNLQWGWSGDIPVPADYDGDGKTDRATWRPSDGTWYIHFSSGRPDVSGYQWGWSNDIPVPADYDGDGKADIATWRPSDGTWWIDMSTAPDIMGYQWGWSADIPVPADYDGDGKVDIGTWRPSTGGWWIDMSTAPNINGYLWGWSTDVPVTGDYDADGYTDIAIWRPSTGQWIVDMSHNSDWNPGPQWGWSSDIPSVSTLNRKILQGLGLRPPS